MKSRFSTFWRLFAENLQKLLITAFGLVAALAWNTAIKAKLEQDSLQDKHSLLSNQWLYAITVTVISVLVTVCIDAIVAYSYAEEDLDEENET